MTGVQTCALPIYETRRCPAFPEEFAQDGDVEGEIVVLYKRVGPDLRHQFLFVDDPAAVLDEHDEQVERFGGNRKGAASALYGALPGVEPEITELVNALLCQRVIASHNFLIQLSAHFKYCSIAFWQYNVRRVSVFADRTRQFTPERIPKMIVPQKLLSSLALVLLTTSASAGPIVYVVTGNQQFGTVDLATGAFSQIGPDTPAGEDGLVPGLNGSLLTLTYSGNLDSINPATGIASLIGATGLADCSSFPVSPCGPTSANELAGLGGTIYATDISNNLYTVNPLTGAATLIGPTGIPVVPAIPGSTNPDGTFNAFDESLFSARGSLYATFDAIKINPSPFTVTTVISPDLYEINPTTGHATLIAPTALTIGAVVGVNGTLYAFNNMAGQVATLNLANGNTTAVSNFPPDGGLLVQGASPDTPEPASFALVGIGIAAVAVRRRRRDTQR